MDTICLYFLHERQMSQEERGGSVVQCFTRGVAGSSLTGGTALCPL